MNKTYLMTIAAALLAAPLAFAHEPAGTPKNYCEPEGEWNTHDYGPPANSRVIAGYHDGNVGGDCSGGTNLGEPCYTLDPSDPLGFSAGLCNFDPPIADYDGHAEFTLGGAILLACDVACGVSGRGAGALECFGDAAHHGSFVTVTDIVLGEGASFIVGIDGAASADDPRVPITEDSTDLLLPDIYCGDGLVNRWEYCIGSCQVLMPAGLDGAYYVFVQGTLGHVTA